MVISKSILLWASKIKIVLSHTLIIKRNTCFGIKCEANFRYGKKQKSHFFAAVKLIIYGSRTRIFQILENLQSVSVVSRGYISC